MQRLKHLITPIVFFAILFGLLLGFVLLPDAALSHSERRKLQQAPQATPETVQSTAYMQDLEKYMQDQFPGRELLRQAKARFRYQLLAQRDSNDIYLYEGSAVKMELQLKTNEVRYAAEKINAIREQYLQDMKVYAAVIPDKNYFAAAPSGHLGYDYDKLLSIFTETLTGADYVDIFGALKLSDYYLSDAHWKQESLGGVRDILAEALGVADRLPSMTEGYEQTVLDGFSGVYLGQSALPVSKDSLRYLESPAMKNAIVKSEEKKNESFSVYAPDKIFGTDGYDVFLNGAQALMTIENPAATTDKELILFRDSFGSSIAPLFIDAYSKITLIDLRYMDSKYLGEFVDFDAQDVLFLYSTGIINSGRLLR